MLKILILGETEYPDPYFMTVLQPVAADARLKVVGLVVHPRSPKTKWQLLKALRRRLRGGVFLVMLLEKVFKRRQKGVVAEGAVRRSIPSLFTDPDFPVISFSALDAPARDRMAAFGADLMILAGYHQMVKPAVISLFPRGVLSYHYGDMRKYRGQPPAFWEMLHGEESAGITVQQISAGIDMGAPVKEMSIPILKGERIEELRQRMLKASESMMYQALCCYLNPQYSPAPLTVYGAVYTFPGIVPWIRFHWKTGFCRRKSD